MGNEYKKIGEYKVKEVYNDNGKKIQELLVDIFKSYFGSVVAILHSGLSDGEKYDVIVIDGKRRAECAATAVKALADGGMIILDDSDRVNTSLEYVNAIKILRAANLLQVDFYGFCPMNNYTKATSIFFARDFDFDSLYTIQPINGWGNIWSMSRKERKQFFKKQEWPLAEED